MHKITYETEMSFEEDCDFTNESLRLLDCSPLKKHVRTDRASTMEKERLRNSQRNAIALTEPDLENENCNSCLSLVTDIKEKLKICNKQETVQLLTIVPDDWSIKKTVKFFNVTEHSVKMAQKLRKEQGILAVPKGYSREAEKETKVKVKEFFERDDVSCLCPAKACVSVKLEDGRKEKVQKRLVVKLEGDLPTFCDRRPCCESWILCICHAMIKVVCTSEIIWDTQCMCMYVSPKCETNA